MNSIPKTPLQAELERIENEAKAKSLAIMHKADDLNNASYLCDLINAGLVTEQQVAPHVLYLDENSAEISIYLGHVAKQVLHRIADIALSWDDVGEAYPGTRDLRIHNFERIELRVKETDLAAYHESCLQAL